MDFSYDNIGITALGIDNVISYQSFIMMKFETVETTSEHLY